MSQPPWPSVPPQQYGYPMMPPDVLAPARRAGILMIVIGLLHLLPGACLAFVGPQLLALSPNAQQQEALHQMEQTAGISIETICIALGAVLLALAVLQIILGIFIYRCGFIASILGAILTGLILLFLAVQAAEFIIRGSPSPAAGLCMFGVSVALHGLLFMWLIQAARSAKYAAWFKHQAYANPYPYGQYPQAPYTPPYMGYGYPPQSPPAPPAAPAPPTPPQDPH